MVPQRVQLFPVVPGDRVRVAKALGHDQQQTRAFALQERVQANGRPVHEEVDGTGLGHELTKALEHAVRRVGGCREHLAGDGLRGVLVDDDEIRERAADVHCHPITAQRTSLSRLAELRTMLGRPAPGQA